MGAKNGSAISRREFARRAALVSAAASLSPAELLTNAPSVEVAPSTQAPAAKTSATTTAAPQPQTPGAAKLSPESQMEADSRVDTIFNQYSSRLNDTQRADLRRLAAEGQAGLDRLRAFATDNGDGSALYLKPLMEREKKPARVPAPATKAPAGTSNSPAAPKPS